MSDIIIKSENEDNDDSNDSLSALTTLLKEVKKEEHPEVLSDNETQTENNKGSETLPESFFDDLYRDELEAGPAEATTDADIAKLQEIIARKKRILHDVSEDVEGGDGPLDNRCKRKDKTNDGDKQSGNGAKRSRTTLDTSEDAHPNNNADEGIDQNNTTQPSSSSANECPEPSEEAADPEMELEKLLKTEDYYSNEEVSNPNQNIQFSNNNMQQMYGFPNGMGMMPTMYNPGATQMMGNMPPGGYPMMPNMGFPPGFYPPNMVNMQMMGYGFPQINVPSNNNEVECLPVDTSAGLPKITFKKIKLEKSVDKTVPPAEDPRKKVIDACTLLLEKLEFAEPTGKFIFTSTVTKLDNTTASNSILQKITNVSYNFQSIGPRQNLQDWGLKGIPSANVEIAKKISMSADKYFKKISENANTIARKMVKQEVAKADKKQNQEDMEVEEVTLSSYFKNSMTQTEPLTCRECVARKRKVGHEIAVQATVYTGSIGTQTTPRVRFSDQIVEGMSDNQLKAMYEFSMLIREPPKNTSAELIRLREQLINMYNLSQRQHKGPVPFVDASQSLQVQNTVRDPRIDQGANFDPRRSAGLQNQIAQQPPEQTFRQDMPHYPQHGMHSEEQIQSLQQHRVQNTRNDPSNYNQHEMPIERNQTLQQRQISSQFPGRGRPQGRSMQNPSQQRRNGIPGQHFDQALPEFPGQEFHLPEGRKNYGRGGLRR
ncbi:uncharacterized protein LOC129908803 isoform X2 [Episyrphus balteatus]|uniref:uncharacterized protein LOC129908803 isoform X2 n=1 Tax=Episyrphus balteatus TaxID=286459 RepID=UPI002484E129|nr:uncharacterized protein LOC129908803 isoform X2 [Episyrphus balteatus]